METCSRVNKEVHVVRMRPYADSSPVVGAEVREGMQAVLDSASGVTGISERLLERLRRHFGGVDVGH